MTRLTTTTTAKKAAPKVATKVAEKPEAKRVTRARVMPRTYFVVAPYARPFSGVRLYSHTHAALTFTGLLQGRTVAKAVLVRLIGSNAIDYHSDEGRFATGDKGIALSKDGVKFFAGRAQTAKVNPDMVSGFLRLFETGQTSDVIGVRQEHVEHA